MWNKIVLTSYITFFRHLPPDVNRCNECLAVKRDNHVHTHSHANTNKQTKASHVQCKTKQRILKTCSYSISHTKISRKEQSKDHMYTIINRQKKRKIYIFLYRNIYLSITNLMYSPTVGRSMGQFINNLSNHLVNNHALMNF